MADLFDIAGLIAADKVVKPVDINLTDSYIQIGTFSPENRKKGGAANSYPSLVMSLADIVSGGGGTYSGDGTTIVLNPGNIFSFASMNISQFTNDSGYITSAAIPITNNIIPKGNGTSIVDGTWEFSVNDIIPTTTGSNIGSPTNRIGTIYMASTIDYATNLAWNSTSERMRLTTTGELLIGTTTLPINFGEKLVVQSATDAYNTVFTDGTRKLATYIGTGGGEDAVQIGVESAHDLLIYGYNGGAYNTFIKYNESAVNKYWGVNTYNLSAAWHVTGQSATSADFALKIDNISSAPLLHVRNDGNVGIGTTSPSQKLHINGTTRIEDAIYIANDGYLTFSAGTNVSLMSLTGKYLSLRSVDTHIEFMTNGLERMRITAAGNVGIGTITPVARLNVIGLGNTSATLGLQVESANTQNWLRVYDDGTLWSQGAANNAHLFASYVGNVSATYDSPGTQFLEFKIGGVIKSQLINQTNLTRFNQAAGQFWGVYGSDNNPYILFDETSKNVGIGTGALDPNARMTINGDLNLGSNLISTGNAYNLISTKQNQHGIVSYRSGSDDIYAGLGITDGGIWYFRANKNGRTLINTTADAGGGPGTESLYVASTTGDAAIWINSVGGSNVYPTLIFGNGGTQYSYIQGTGSNLILGTNNNFQVRNRLTNATKLFIEPLGNTLFTYDPTGTETPTARLETRGEDDGSVFFAFKAKNKTGATKLSIRNDGQVNISSLQTSGTGSPPIGLVSGDLWLDTSLGGNPLVSIVP